MNIGDVAASAIGVFERRKQADAYKTDPAKWVHDHLGLKMTLKQREIAQSLIDNRGTLVASAHGQGKGLALDTPIPTPTGWTTMGELKVGDEVFDEAGNPTTVTYKSPVHNIPCYRVTFNDGATLITDNVHLWETIDPETVTHLTETGVGDWREHWDSAKTRKVSKDLVGHLIPVAGEKVSGVSKGETTFRVITEVAPVDSEPTQCITVDSPRSLYLAGEEMIPTHNTFSEALLGLWWVNVFYDDGVFLATTAPSAAQVNIFWDYLKKFHGIQKARYETGDSPTPPIGYITGQNQWKDDSGIIIGEGRKPPEDKSDVAFQGRHAPYLLVLADEAVGVPKNLIDAMGNLATGDNNRQLLVANPTTLNCEMYRMWKLSETDPEYGKNWNRVTISVLDSPLIKEDPYLPAKEADGMAGWAFYDQKLKDYGGVDDPRFMARVLGQWAQDEGSTVFTMEEVSRAMDTVVIVDDTKRKEVGVDISGLGDDYSVVYLRETGEIWTTSETGEPLEPTGKMGFRFRQVGRWNKTPLAGGNELRPDSAMKVNELVLNYGAMVAKIDASGIGMAVIQGITGSLNPPYTVVSVFGGAAARDPRTYVNSRAELFFDLKLAMQRGEIDIDPDDDMLREQMETLRYEENENKKIKIESKDSMRRRGVKSPDELDTVAYAFKDVDDLFEDRLDPGEQILLDLEDMEFDRVRNGFLM